MPVIKKPITCILCDSDDSENASLLCRLCANRVSSAKDHDPIHSELRDKLKAKRKLLNKYKCQNLREHNTKACRRCERLLMEIAGKFPLKYCREKVFAPFIVDFYLDTIGAAIEIDGKIHDHRFSYDNMRDDWLRKIYKIPIYRFTNDDTKTPEFKQALWDIYMDGMNSMLMPIGYEIVKRSSIFTSGPNTRETTEAMQRPRQKNMLAYVSHPRVYVLKS